MQNLMKKEIEKSLGIYNTDKYKNLINKEKHSFSLCKDDISLMEGAEKILYVYLRYRPDMTYFPGMAYLVTMLLRNLKSKQYESF